jgi:hypothetical protein
MTSATVIREAITARPFKPFTVRVSDQRSYLVPHPDFILVGPNGRTVVIVLPDDGVRVLDTLHITSLDFDPEQARAGHAGGASTN